MKATLRYIYLCRTANMSWRTCVVVKQIQSNPTWRGMSMMHLPTNNKQLVSSLTLESHTRQFGCMVSCMIYTGLDWEEGFPSLFLRTSRTTSSRCVLVRPYQTNLVQRCPHWKSIGSHLFWSQDQWLTPPHSTRYRQSSICWWLGHLLPWKLSICHWKTYPTHSGCYPRVGITEWLQFCWAQVQDTALYSTKAQAWTTSQHYDEPCTLASWRDHQVPRTLVGFKLNFGKHITAKKKQSKKAINLLRVVAHTKWGGDRDTLLMLYRELSTPSWTMDALYMALQPPPASTNSTVSITQALDWHLVHCVQAQSGACTLKQTSPHWRNAGSSCQCITFWKYVKCPAYLTMKMLGRATKQLYKVGPNGRGGMIQPPMAPVGIRMKATMEEADINTCKICPLDIPDLPPITHSFGPKSNNLIEGVTKVEISSFHAKFQECQDEQGNHDEVYTDGSKINEKVGAAAIIKCLFQDGKTNETFRRGCLTAAPFIVLRPLLLS